MRSGAGEKSAAGVLFPGGGGKRAVLERGKAAPRARVRDDEHPLHACEAVVTSVPWLHRPPEERPVELPGPRDVVTDVLSAAQREGRDVFEDLLPLVYDELRQMARRHLAREWRQRTLNTTGLVHEAYLKLVDHGARAGEEPGLLLRRGRARHAPGPRGRRAPPRPAQAGRWRGASQPRRTSRSRWTTSPPSCATSTRRWNG